MAILDVVEASRAGNVLLWTCATASLYYTAKMLYRRWPRIWLMPIVLAPLLLIALLLIMHENAQHYAMGAGWLVTLVGPATIAFAVPIYEKRALIRAHWPTLALGIVVGSATAIVTAYELSTALHLDATLRASLLPRSFNTPFAMVVSSQIGGVPNLTAFFVILTGLTCAIVGRFMVCLLPVRSSLARGALLGMAGHAAGTVKAFEFGREEGTIAGLVMILAGLMNVVTAPLLVILLRFQA